MAEYALAAVINLERRFKLALQLQNQKTWSSRFLIISTTKIEMLIPDYFSPELKGYRCLSELTVGILGIGQIGLSSAKLLRGFIFLKQTSATTSNLCICRSGMQSSRSGEQGKDSNRNRRCDSIFYQTSAPTTAIFRGLSYQHFTLHPRHR